MTQPPRTDGNKKAALIKMPLLFNFTAGKQFSIKTMVSILKRGASQQEQLAIKARLRKKPVLDIRKFCGILKLQEDPLEIQKQLRSEWK